MPVTPVPLPRAGFARRIGALIYDWMLLVGLLMVAEAIAVGVVAGLAAAGLVDLTGYADVSAYLTAHRGNSLYLTMCVIGFYGFFWCRAGQTLGMRAWRLRVQNSDGSRIRLTQAVVRACAALFGFGNLWVLFDNRKLAWQDRVADCEVVLLPKAVPASLNRDAARAAGQSQRRSTSAR